MVARGETRYIVWHTAAWPNNDDVAAAVIDADHRGDKGWEAIGYHYVIRQDGRVEAGRDEHAVGAHVRGLNACSIGVCFSGHHDLAAPTAAQYRAGLRLTRQLMARYDIPAEHVIGHRQVNALIAAGVVAARWRTAKTCPGTHVDMANIRRALVSCPASDTPR